MDKTKKEALLAFANDVRFQFYARESIASALELMAEKIDELEALLEQLKPPAKPVTEPVQAGADTNVGA